MSRAASIGVLGSLIFLAPDNMMPDRIAIGQIVATAGHAEQSGSMARHLSKINAADDACFKAAIAIEAAGDSRERLDALKKADDRYFEAVMAFEAASSETVQIAKVGAADYTYFDAVIALETSGENLEDLKKLKDADDAYFSAVIALEDAYAKQAELKKAAKPGKPVKVASAASSSSNDASKPPTATAMAHPAPLPVKKSWAAKKTYRPVRTATVVQHPQHVQPAGPLSLFYNIVTFPVRVVAGGSKQGK